MTKGKGRNPGAGNLDKHIKRTEHKERSQPAARKHLGQLEKHKDHVQRAKKRRGKVEKLNKIKRAVAQRNPDEFNIGMTKAIMDLASGRMKQRKKHQLPQERDADLKKTIDGNLRNVQYLEFKAQADMTRAKDLLEEEGAAAITASKPQNTHTVFVESEEEFRRFNPLVYFDTTKEMLLQHPAVRGKISVLKSTVLPDEVLLSGGHTMKSDSQKRKERRELTRKLQTIGDDEEAREAFLERTRAKQELKQYRFSDLIAADDTARRTAAKKAAGGGDARHNHDDDDDDDDDEEGSGKRGGGGPSSSASSTDDVAKLLEWRREKERLETVDAARRMREVTQRVERSKSLNSLAKMVRRQNSGIKKQLTQKADSRFKPNATRRAR